jgi:peptidoglycan/xylan/chitin deacetylase (PgdA/CDA1 family)
MITIQAPKTYELERKYIFSIMFVEFLGLDIQIDFINRQDVIINLDDNKYIRIVDGLFLTPLKDWLQPNSIPNKDLKSWDITNLNLDPVTVFPRIPIIYGEDPEKSTFFQQSEDSIYLGLDIFGSSFFMLTRYEEIVKPDKDLDDRFPVTASLSYQAGFLDRPIVNEYLEILWACIKYLNPNYKRKLRKFKTYLTHDVDEPYRYVFSGLKRLASRCVGDVWKRRSYGDAINSIYSWMQVKTGNITADPCNTFDLIMDISEQNNIKSAFYFITDRTSAYDGDYSINHPLIRKLLRRIADRGHEIGLHPSYNTYQNPKQTKKEFELLQQACEQEGIYQQRWGGRQHCLRWENPATFQNWDAAGLDYDSTLYFAETLGFRCGTCYEYSVFDIVNRRQLNLKERPLTIMEVTVFEDHYMGLRRVDSVSRLNVMNQYKDLCKKFHGDFVILWHNNSFSDPQLVNDYLQIIR